jgi:hypothetical protein
VIAAVSVGSAPVGRVLLDRGALVERGALIESGGALGVRLALLGALLVRGALVEVSMIATTQCAVREESIEARGTRLTNLFNSILGSIAVASVKVVLLEAGVSFAPRMKMRISSSRTRSRTMSSRARSIVSGC